MQLTTDKKQRKEIPVATGCIAYFPLAIAAVSHVSYVGNQQHNPGEPMHWARDKSKDHEDCIGRHLTDYLMDPDGADTDGLYHDEKLAWRALALCQIAQERRRGLSPTVLGGDVPFTCTLPKGEELQAAAAAMEAVKFFADPVNQEFIQQLRDGSLHIAADQLSRIVLKDGKIIVEPVGPDVYVGQLVTEETNG